MAAGKLGYNVTQLYPFEAMERQVVHRDMFAHVFRWSHVLKNAKIGQTILDFGCGSGEMFELFYRNRYKPKRYLGLDVRAKTIEENSKKFEMCKDYCEFRAVDLCQPELDLEETFDVVTCFEVIEHIGHANADVFLDNLAFHCSPDTVIYLSTPNYDERVGAAENHILKDGEIGEWKHEELQKKLEEFFHVEAKYGTFASIKDYKDYLHQEGNEWLLKTFETLSAYYDTNVLAVLMAPMVPANMARNCLWKLSLKEVEE